jgi:hypothetical protein
MYISVNDRWGYITEYWNIVLSSGVRDGGRHLQEKDLFIREKWKRYFLVAIHFLLPKIRGVIKRQEPIATIQSISTQWYMYMYKVIISNEEDKGLILWLLHVHVWRCKIHTCFEPYHVIALSSNYLIYWHQINRL